MTTQDSLQSAYINTAAHKQQTQTQSNRNTARMVGIFYIIATVSGILSIALGPDLEASNYLANLSANENQVTIGAFFELMMAVSVAGVAFTIYPLLKKTHESLALWYVGARLLEGVLYIVGVLCLLLLWTLSKEFVAAGAAAGSAFQVIGTVLLAAREWAGGALNSTVGFGISAIFFYYLLYRSHLIPRWLSGWGLIGAPLWIAAGVLGLFGEDPQSTISVILYMPIAINEMVLALWLIFKGFNPVAVASAFSKPEFDSA